MNVIVIDGQGGRMGRAIVEELRERCPELTVTAIGTNSTATASMMKAGAGVGATGEYPGLVACRELPLSDYIRLAGREVAARLEEAQTPR